MNYGIEAITTKLPTFLQALLGENYCITLVYHRKKIRSPSSAITADKEDADISQCDLTGTPLKIDLGCNDTVCTELTLTRPPIWTSEEAQYYPLTLSEARTFINNHIKVRTTSAPIYCICNGNDVQHTVILSAAVTGEEIIRTLVYILPCCIGDDEVTTLQYMKNDHIKNGGKSTQIKVLTTQCYNLFGYNLRNCSCLQNIECNGNISMEVVNTESQINSTFKMNVQVVIGHNSSPVYKFWEELGAVQRYIELLVSKQLNKSTEIASSNHLDYMEITAIILEFLNNVNNIKKNMLKQIDLGNLRHENILDKLWNILKYCRTLSDLRDSFHFFFEELMDKQSRVILVSHNSSPMADIVNGIVEGKLAVPTLSFSQSLELLIELGLEKLKLDYVTIIGSIYGNIQELVFATWSSFNSENIAALGPSVNRKSRISINPKTAVSDVLSSKLKLSYLYSMHTATELVYMCKENLPTLEESFDFCEAVCSKYITDVKKVIPCSDVGSVKLIEFLFDANAADAYSLIKDKSPIAWATNMTSSTVWSQATTIFYFSEHPIFPNSVYDNYDVPPEDNQEKSLYVTKLVKHIENC